MPTGNFGRMESAHCFIYLMPVKRLRGLSVSANSFCVIKLAVPVENQIERYFSLGNFREKRNTYRGIPFSRFYRNYRNITVPFAWSYWCHAP